MFALIGLLLATLASAQIRRNTLKAEVELTKYWSLSFMIRPHGDKWGWTNILHLSGNGSNTGSGGRIPAVFFHSNSRRLHVCMSCDGDGNTNMCVNPTKALPKNRWTHVKITSWAGKLIVNVQGRGYGLRSSENCEPYEPMKGDTGKLYVSDPWYPAADASVRSVRYSRINAFEIQKGNLINDQLSISTGFTLSFNIQPSRTVPGWSSIIHVTETGTNGGAGGRHPAVFFHDKSTRLFVCAYCQVSLTGHEERCISADYDLPLSKTSSIVIAMKEDSSYEPDTFRKGTSVLSVIISNDEYYKEYKEFCGWPYEPSSSTAEMYYGDPWTSPADARLTNVVYTATNIDAYGRRRVEETVDPTVGVYAEPPMAQNDAELLAPQI